MRYKSYLPGVKKRLVKLKLKRLVTFSGVFTIIIVIGIGGNLYLKSNSTINNALFWQPEDTQYKMTLQVNAMSKDIETITKERDTLLDKVKEKEKLVESVIPENKPDIAPTQKPILNKKIKSIAHNLGGVMTGHSTYLYNKSLEYNLDPLMVAAIIKHESGNGTSRAIRRQNNIAGFMGNRGLMTFYTIDNSIDFMVELLKNHYIDQGLNTLEKIQPKYCPIGAANDPTGLNRHWLPTVRAYYKTITEESV
jgi:hypothetical protein